MNLLMSQQENQPSLTIDRQALRSTMRGSELAAGYFDELRSAAERIMRPEFWPDRAALGFGGSAGGRHLLSGSDTDLILLGVSRGDLPEKQQFVAQGLEEAARQNRWKINFHDWEEVKKRPAELRSVPFLGGDRRVFLEAMQQASAAEVVSSSELLSASLARSDLYAEYRSCGHPGSVKYARGGLRDIEALYRAANLYASAKWSGDILEKPASFTDQASFDLAAAAGILNAAEVPLLEMARDFFLAAKDVLIDPSPLVPENAAALAALWQMTPKDLGQSCTTHFGLVQKILERVRLGVLRDFSDDHGVIARRTTDDQEILRLIAEELQDREASLWLLRWQENLTTMSLRYDLSIIWRLAVDCEIDNAAKYMDVTKLKQYWEWATKRCARN